MQNRALKDCPKPVRSRRSEPNSEQETTSVASRRVWVIDSHTGGEPTRLLVSGVPDLGDAPVADRVERFREEHDPFGAPLCTTHLHTPLRRCALPPAEICGLACSEVTDALRHGSLSGTNMRSGDPVPVRVDSRFHRAADLPCSAGQSGRPSHAGGPATKQI